MTLLLPPLAVTFSDCRDPPPLTASVPSLLFNPFFRTKFSQDPDGGFCLPSLPIFLFDLSNQGVCKFLSRFPSRFPARFVSEGPPKPFQVFQLLLLGVPYQRMVRKPLGIILGLPSRLRAFYGLHPATVQGWPSLSVGSLFRFRVDPVGSQGRLPSPTGRRLFTPPPTDNV